MRILALGQEAETRPGKGSGPTFYQWGGSKGTFEFAVNAESAAMLLAGGNELSPEAIMRYAGLYTQCR